MPFDLGRSKSAARGLLACHERGPLTLACQRPRVEWSRGDSNPRAETVVRTRLRVYPPIDLGTKTAGGGVTSCLDRLLSRAPEACQPLGASPMVFDPHLIGRRAGIVQPVN